VRLRNKILWKAAEMRNNSSPPASSGGSVIDAGHTVALEVGKLAAARTVMAME
jgi:hypothetical protein